MKLANFGFLAWAHEALGLFNGNFEALEESVEECSLDVHLMDKPVLVCSDAGHHSN